MKNIRRLLAGTALLLALTGCGADKTGPSEPGPDPVDPVELGVPDLEEILSGLEISGAELTFSGENGDTRPADAAIRAEHYVQELRDYTWESCPAPAEWDGDDSARCVFAGDGISLTAYQSGYDGNAVPLHAVTERGEGWFTLPNLYAEQEQGPEQVDWMLFDTFERWYLEAKTADLYGGAASPLTAEELTWFQEFTASEQSYYHEEWGGYSSGSTAISCFFTSKYEDPRDMDAEEFLAYCPSAGDLEAEDEAEFQLVQAKLDWRGGEDNHLLSVTEMPTPCHRLPRAYINEILTQYAGITVEDMHTDWKETAFYIPATDCFYTFTSDFGPGRLVPCYGERDGDIVMLWEAPDRYDEMISDVLTLQKNGDGWLILSHQAAA